jgi:hypothetical protein
MPTPNRSAWSQDALVQSVRTGSGLFEYAKELATERFTERGEFEPSSIVIDSEDGQRTICGVPFPETAEAKDQLYASLREFLRDHGVVRYAHISESWIGSAGHAGRPSQDPDRREAVVIVMADRLGHRQCAIAEIKRSGDGAPTLQPWAEADHNRMTGMTGPLLTLLETSGSPAA